MQTIRRNRSRPLIKRITYGNIYIHSFILAISIALLQVHYYSESLPTTARILYWSFTRSAQATVSKGLALGPYMAARAGVEPTTLRLRFIDLTNAPPRPTLYRALLEYIWEHLRSRSMAVNVHYRISTFWDRRTNYKSCPNSVADHHSKLCHRKLPTIGLFIWVYLFKRNYPLPAADHQSNVG